MKNQALYVYNFVDVGNVPVSDLAQYRFFKFKLFIGSKA
jgi:hypothetical protein